MRIGIPLETKPGERRVGLVPPAVAALAAEGHELVVAAGAGIGAGAPDESYREAGARVVEPAGAWNAELVVKVKELQPGEHRALGIGTTLFSFQHLVGEPALARALAGTGASAIAYELVRDAGGGFPLLAPMSALAGRLAIQAGANLLGLPAGGNGTLLAACPGVAPARVLVLGAGHAGEGAAALAAAMGARVTVLTRTESRRAQVAARLGPGVTTGLADAATVEREALGADLVVGAVFVPGAPTPKLLPRTLVARMRRGAVIVDVSIDAGGVAETSRPTTHADPAYIEEGVVHYAVPNMPAAVARTGAEALSAAALPYVRALAGRGVARALREDAGLAAGVVIWRGGCAHEGIARECGLPYVPLAQAAPA